MPRLLTRTFQGTLVLALLLPAVSSANGGSPSPVRYTHGVAAGEVTSTSAIPWTRVRGTRRVTLVVSRSRRLRGRTTKRYRLRVRRSNDYTVQRRVRRLRPGRRYWFRFQRGRRRSKRGSFRTAYSRSQNRTIRFAFSGDTDFISAPGQTRPYWNTGGVLRRMRSERNNFNIHFGDTIYSDSEVPGRGTPAVSVRAKWGKYRLNTANRQMQALRRSAGFYSHWDDHEFINDFSPAENSFDNSFSGQQLQINGRVLYNRSVRAFRDYSPVRYTRRDGIYRRIRWGRNLELFFLDQRSFRSAKADDGGVCNNPQTGSPDNAPTLPQSYRNLYGGALPTSGLTQPVSPACLARIRSPQRTYLGRRQMNRFKRAIDRSTARFKVIMNELPIQQYYALPYDRWEGYEAERQQILRFLRSNVKNTIFLTTDVHATLVNDARFQTLEQGGAQNSGITDFTVGPVATANLELEYDDELGSGSGDLIKQFAFEPQPPTGVGMRCSVMDRFGYGQVRVSRSRLTVLSKGIDGRQLPGCAPLTLNYQR